MDWLLFVGGFVVLMFVFAIGYHTGKSEKRLPLRIIYTGADVYEPIIERYKKHIEYLERIIRTKDMTIRLYERLNLRQKE